MKQPKGYPQITYDVESSPNGIAWFPVSSAHFKLKDAKAERDRRLQFKKDLIRITRVTKEVIA